MNKTLRIMMLGIILGALGSSVSASTPEGWTSDYKAAQSTAKKLDKLMLLMFTGSDWCVWCRRTHNEILDTPTFMDWAADNLVLVYVDFPRKDYRSRDIGVQNEKLDEQYDISGYPTMVLTTAQGKELTRLGYMQGGPKTFIRAIKRAGNNKADD